MNIEKLLKNDGFFVCCDEGCFNVKRIKDDYVFKEDNDGAFLRCIDLFNKDMKPEYRKILTKFCLPIRWD